MIFPEYSHQRERKHPISRHLRISPVLLLEGDALRVGTRTPDTPAMADRSTGMGQSLNLGIIFVCFPFFQIFPKTYWCEKSGEVQQLHGNGKTMDYIGLRQSFWTGLLRCRLQLFHRIIRMVGRTFGHSNTINTNDTWYSWIFVTNIGGYRYIL